MKASTMTMRQLGWRLMLMAWLACCGMPAGAETRVRVLDAPAPAVAALRNLAPDIGWLTDDSAAADISLVWQADNYGRQVERHPDQPVLLLAQGASGLTLRPEDAALLWGPSLAAQLQLARQALPSAQRVGILHRAGQRAEVEALKATAGIDILSREVSPPLAARDIAELAQRVDILIAGNDEQLFSRDSAKLVLLTAYRHQRAWIGPTPAFVTAGALATRAVGKGTLLHVIVDRVRGWARQHRLGASQQLPADEVVCNRQVARSLGLSLSQATGCPGGEER